MINGIERTSLMQAASTLGRRFASAHCVAALMGLTSVVAPVPAWSAPSNLAEIFASALQGNPALRGRELELQRAQAESDGWRSRQGPQLLATAAMSVNEFSESSVGRHGYGGQRVALVGRQPLYDPATGLRVNAADAAVAQRTQEASAARNALLGALLERYLQALVAQEEWSAVQAESAAAQRQVQRLRALREREMVRVNDLAEAEAYAQTLVTRGIDARNQQAQALAHLRELSGLAVVEVQPLRANAFESPAGELERWQLAAAESSPRLRAMRQAVEAARAAAEATRADDGPQLALTLNHTWSDQGYDSRRQPRYQSTSIGLELRVPLYDHGRARSGLREALARLGVAEQAHEEARRAVERDIHAAWLSAEANAARMVSTAAEVTAFELTVAVQERALELGAARVTDVLEARRRWLRAHSDRAKARYDYLRDLVALRMRAVPRDEASLNDWALGLQAAP